MSPKRCLVVLVLSAIVSGVRLTESSPDSNGQQNQDYAIDKFFNTTEEIWVFNTTQPNARMCRKDVNHNMTSNTTFFQRSYLENGTNITEELKGTFDYHRQDQNKVYDTIHVYGDSTGVYQEILEYASQDFTCGVVKVLAFKKGDAFTTVWRDLRVRNRPDNATGIEEECKKQFEESMKWTKRNWTSPYDATCQ
ncbi:uncharacterized protein [Dermacentor andersoni]|uniref:uncharacterized protein n=1 Tax=Dermacentor andersoni TaxID=34620 RepID=UPI00241791B9|nr:uncharacterized protein LOC129385351 [Dermacentor andersoni]